MKITKLGHCCLLIKEGSLTILTDPGSFTTEQNSVIGINLILITHEHADHFHVESLKEVLKNNPDAKIITNQSVGNLLDKENLPYTVIDNGQHTKIDGVTFEGIGEKHADIYKTITPVENTGYMINKRFFYPGDAFTDPKQPIDILALPVTAPWMKASEAIDYALQTKPKIAFPVHDGALNEHGGFLNKMLTRVLTGSGVEFMTLELGREYEL